MDLCQYLLGPSFLIHIVRLKSTPIEPMSKIHTDVAWSSSSWLLCFMEIP